jgi:hypothetical protein
MVSLALARLLEAFPRQWHSWPFPKHGFVSSFSSTYPLAQTLLNGSLIFTPNEAVFALSADISTRLLGAQL